jgi:DNA-binding transcriptional ArsR family regulator
VEEPAVFGFTWQISRLPEDDPRRTYKELSELAGYLDVAWRRRLPITRQGIAKHLALLAEAGLVTAEPGERRRVRYRLQSAPMRVAQQFLAALARDWDSPLQALKDHLDRDSAWPRTRSPARERGPERVVYRAFLEPGVYGGGHEGAVREAAGTLNLT